MPRPTVRLRAAALPLALASAIGLGSAGCGATADGAGAAGPGCTGGETVTVEIPEFAFAPDPVQISACDAVVWLNAHDQAHTSTGTGSQTWTTGDLAPGARSEPVRFESTGSFAYQCALHPFMQGTVEVS